MTSVPVCECEVGGAQGCGWVSESDSLFDGVRIFNIHLHDLAPKVLLYLPDVFQRPLPIHEINGQTHPPKPARPANTVEVGLKVWSVER